MIPSTPASLALAASSRLPTCSDINKNHETINHNNVNNLHKMEFSYQHEQAAFTSVDSKKKTSVTGHGQNIPCQGCQNLAQPFILIVKLVAQYNVGTILARK